MDASNFGQVSCGEYLGFGACIPQVVWSWDLCFCKIGLVMVLSSEVVEWFGNPNGYEVVKV